MRHQGRTRLRYPRHSRNLPASLSRRVPRFVSVFLLSLALSSCSRREASGDDDAPPPDLRQKNKTAVDAACAAALAKCKGNPDMLVLPGLVADKKKNQVLVYAEATGLTGQGDPPEFFLIAENSGHDYESLAVSFAKPSDVHKALLFIGMEPGAPVNFRKLRFWPKGERVFMSLSCRTTKPEIGPVRVETLLLDKKTGLPQQKSGLVFVGSYMIAGGTNGAAPQSYAADIREPNSIAANYNEPGTVFDVPRPAEQQQSYDTQAVNPDCAFPAGAILEVLIEPEHKAGTKRVADFLLSLGAKTTNGPGSEARLAPVLKDAANNVVNAGADLPAVLKSLLDTAQSGRDPFVTVCFADALPLRLARDVCAALAVAEGETGIRVEPPLPGDLFFRAFLPNEAHRDRNKRPSQPCELHLSLKDGKVDGTLTYIREIWKPDESRPDLVATNFAAPTPQALRRKLDELCRTEFEEDIGKSEDQAVRDRFLASLKAVPDEALWTEQLETLRRDLRMELPVGADLNFPMQRVLLVFADPALSYGQLMLFVRPILTSHDTIHVFLAK